MGLRMRYTRRGKRPVSSTSVNMSKRRIKLMLFVHADCIFEDELLDVIEELHTIAGLRLGVEEIYGGFLIKISARSESDIDIAWNELENISHEGELWKSEHFNYFSYTKKGQQFLADVGERGNVCVWVCYYRLCVYVRGRRKAVKWAMGEIVAPTNMLTEQLPTHVFDLSEFSAGMSERLTDLYEVDLSGLLIDSGAEMVSLDPSKHLLTVHGSLKSVDYIRYALYNQAREMRKIRTQAKTA